MQSPSWYKGDQHNTYKIGNMGADAYDVCKAQYKVEIRFLKRETD
jgi:hypothetical protein